MGMNLKWISLDLATLVKQAKSLDFNSFNLYLTSNDMYRFEDSESTKIFREYSESNFEERLKLYEKLKQ